MSESRSVAQVLAVPLVALIRLYQLWVSPMLSLTQQCRFYPSCSAYAVTALTRYGLLKGSWLAAHRLLRCHPWNPGGVDHVPLTEPSEGQVTVGKSESRRGSRPWPAVGQRHRHPTPKARSRHTPRGANHHGETAVSPYERG